jgi:Bifunctional DNA primase/polymerase, N-terminal
VLEIDIDSNDALGEATAYGLPPAPVMRTAKGRRYRYRCPHDLAGRRVTKRGVNRSIDVLAGGYVVVAGRHRFGAVYEWVVSPAGRPLHDAPQWALEMLRAADAANVSAVDLHDVEADVQIERLALSPRLRQVIADGGGASYPSRSEAVHAVTLAMVGAGYDDATIAGVLLDARNGISSKPRQQGRRWLAGEIARARHKRPVGVL